MLIAAHPYEPALLKAADSSGYVNRDQSVASRPAHIYIDIYICLFIYMYVNTYIHICISI